MPPPDPDLPPIPKFALGDAFPDGPAYVVRLRSPYLLARVATCLEDPARVVLHCWPPDYAEGIPPGKLRSTLQGLVRYFARATHQSPPEWHAVPHDPAQLPPCLLLDNTESAWTGILQPAAPRLWEVDDSEATSTTDTGPAVSFQWLPHFTGPFPTDPHTVRRFYYDYTDTP